MAIAISHFWTYRSSNRTSIIKVAEFGSYDQQDGIFAIMAEIFLRGPVKASINAGPLQRYEGGIILDSPANRNTTHNHGVSLVGWGYDEAVDIQYWIVRNSVRITCTKKAEIVIVACSCLSCIY